MVEFIRYYILNTNKLFCYPFFNPPNIVCDTKHFLWHYKSSRKMDMRRPKASPNFTKECRQSCRGR